MLGLPVFFSAAHSLIVAMVLVACCAGIVMLRRSRLGRSDIWLALGCLLIALAAGGPMLNRGSSGLITVMVDLSPSTRGATFRDRDALESRLHQLLGDRPYRILAFGDSDVPLPTDRQLPDLVVDQTTFAPPSSDAIVLFSDGQFELPPTAPPTYPVIDPALDHPADAAVTGLEANGQMVIATVRNAESQSLHWTGAAPVLRYAEEPDRAPKNPALRRISEPASADNKSFVQYAKPTGAGEITASLSPGDRWPENDSLSIRLLPPPQPQRWWIGDSAPADWRQMDPAALPSDGADYLSTAIIVLHNIPADSLSTLQQQRVAQYVRDLGGGLVITGGNRAFAAGNYDGTVLESLSPLASSPPDPTTHWMILIDGSGSMATTDSTGQSPWEIESTAITALLPQLPPHDAVSVGSFAQTLEWWSTGKSAKDTLAMRLPPTSAYAHGPTNLLPAFQQIIASDDGSTITQLLVLTDADTELPDPAFVATAMTQKKIHLHVLAIGHGSALAALRSIASSTGGSVIEQLDPQQWVTSAKQLLKTALPTRYEHQPILVQFNTGPSETASQWNRTWLKPDATLLAKSANAPMAATWQQGLGRVTSTAYPANSSTIKTLAQQIQSDPYDPRFKVSWQNGASLAITVDAIDNNQYLNGEAIQLNLQDANSGQHEEYPVPQSAPGQYELSIDPPRRPMIATVLDGSHPIARFALAGRYPREFSAIGNNYANLSELAHRTRGNVIPPSSIKPIDFHWPIHPIPLQSEFAFAGAAAIAAWIIQQRR